nr:5696_t:CDS:2 [Entrophospora candida]
MQERHVNWMLSCPNPTPLAFFQYIVPTHRVRATEKYYQALDLALSETDNHGLQSNLKKMKETVDEGRILFDWETWMQQKTAVCPVADF